jgi:hypothetical protein
MRGRVVAVVLAVVGLLLAAAVGFAAYYASRDSVGLPVTKLEPTPRHLAPTVRSRTEAHTTTGTTTVEDRHSGTTTDDHSGRGRGGGSGSGRGGGDD